MLIKKSALLGLSISFALSTMMVSPFGFAEGETPIYQPLVKDAPDTRVGGGSRGSRGHRGHRGSRGINEMPVLTIWAPNHTGYTTQAKPSLYWSVSQVVDKPFKFTMVYTDFTLGTEPLIEAELEAPSTSGDIQIVDLNKFDWRNQENGLKPGVEYQWSLSITMDSEQSSNDVVSSGTIMRVDDKMATQVMAKADQVGDQQKPFIYAEQGLWYDAVDTLSKLITTHPDDQELHRQRANLLEQVGLKNVAQSESDIRS